MYPAIKTILMSKKLDFGVRHEINYCMQISPVAQLRRLRPLYLLLCAGEAAYFARIRKRLLATTPTNLALGPPGPAQLGGAGARVVETLGRRGPDGIGADLGVDAFVLAESKRPLHQAVFAAVKADEGGAPA